MSRRNGFACICRQGGTAPAEPGEAYRVRIEAGGNTLGSLWALRDRAEGEPNRTETRLLAAAADQIGQVLAHDRLAAEPQAAEIARQSDALKSALLQSVSHDLRTPLATIRAAAGTLRPGSRLSAEDQQESADAIDREVEYLNRLVTNLLDLSRIEAGALRAERDVFELEDLVGRTVDRLQSRLTDRPVEITLDAPPVLVDPIFLDEALTNVIENAIKYTPPGTRLRISASARSRRALRPAHGRGCGRRRAAGVAPEAVRQVLPRPRAGSQLALGHRDRPGGRPRPDRGDGRPGRPPAAASSAAWPSTSTCRSRPSRPSSRRESGVSGSTGRGPRADWSSSSRTTTRRGGARPRADGRGYRVDEAEDGATALRRWEARRPDVVLLDLGLPDMDGLEVIGRIRREATTPIVILSGRYEEREKVEALERGADDYVTKPFGVDELNARLRVALRHAAGPAGDRMGRLVVGPSSSIRRRTRSRSRDGTSTSRRASSRSCASCSTNAGRLVTKGRLLRAVWGEAYQGEDSYVYVHVSQLRASWRPPTRRAGSAT